MAIPDSFRERQEDLQRNANIAAARMNPDNRMNAQNALKNFGSNVFGGIRNALGRLGRDPNVGRQKFGTSALQQAMRQQEVGNLKPQGKELLDYYSANDTNELQRQRELMNKGVHGDYGVNRLASPYFTDATTKTLPANVKGPLENIGAGNISENVKRNDVAAVNNRFSLDRMMKDPSSLNEEGIKSLQTALNSAGFRDMYGNILEVDGGMGPLTTSAMQRYREQFGQGQDAPVEGLQDDRQYTVGNPELDPPLESIYPEYGMVDKLNQGALGADWFDEPETNNNVPPPDFLSEGSRSFEEHY
tara:strand:- start:1360 stop:2268 length:909 start_codon:yes stop_codon:yes gene_type:complete